MKVQLIVAMDNERGIGKNNDLMWHLPADMNFFKESTEKYDLDYKIRNVLIDYFKKVDTLPVLKDEKIILE